MRKFALAIAAGLFLTVPACTTTEVGTAPAPLAATQADEHILIDLWLTLDFATDTVDILRDEGKLVPGTTKAHQVAALLLKAKTALQTASAIRRGASSGDYNVVLNEARTALQQLKTLIK